MPGIVSKLVAEWEDFEVQHTNSSIEDFCRYYLLREREKSGMAGVVGGHIPPNTNALLLKILGRIGLIFLNYRTLALEETELGIPEGFPFLNALKHLGESKKTDVVNYNLTELSTGIDILNRLKAQGLISERPDLVDRRSKLVSITEKGERVLLECYQKMHVLGEIMLCDMSEDEKMICVQLLKNLEIKHSRLVNESKGKTLEEIAMISKERK
jgi:DNA-binding MarR family transcriptional regulator